MMNNEVCEDGKPATVSDTRIVGKTRQVRQVFENTDRYLESRAVDIRFRVETVKEFAAEIQWQKILDIGCGDGSISLQLLNRESHLTLLDLSTNMIDLAVANIPDALARNVEIRNGDFTAIELESQAFDLIVTVGVMAHVDSPDKFLAKISEILRPGGSLVIEFTDSGHIVGKLGRLWGCLKELLAPAKYSTNRLSFTKAVSLFEKHHLRLISVFRYARLPLPGIDKILSHEIQYRIATLIFGKSRNNRNAWLGNEYICLLTRE